MKTKFDSLPFEQQQIKMNLICNIQMMQNKIYGRSFPFEDFDGNSIKELEALQELMISEYNEKTTTNKFLNQLNFKP